MKLLNSTKTIVPSLNSPKKECESESSKSKGKIAVVPIKGSSACKPLALTKSAAGATTTAVSSSTTTTTTKRGTKKGVDVKNLCPPIDVRTTVCKQMYVRFRRIKALELRDKRSLFYQMRIHSNLEVDTFFPKYGFTAGEFGVWQMLTEKHRRRPSAKTGGKRRNAKAQEEVTMNE